MPSYRFTMGFRSNGKPATETYYHDASDLKDAAVLAGKLTKTRNYMLFNTTEWVGVRIGLADVKRAAQLYTPGTYTVTTDGLAMMVPARGALTTLAGNKQVDQPNSCIQIVLRFGDDRSTKRYLAFVPDECVTGGPDSVELSANPDFAAAYTNFRNLLVTEGWAIQARSITGDFAEKEIQEWVLSDAAPNNMGAAIVLATAPPLKKGDKVAIKNVRRKGTDKVSYNATYRVSAIVDSAPNGTRTVYLGQSDAGDPASIKVLGTLQKVGYQRYPIQAWSWFRAGTHKRGKSFGASAGRRRTRQSIA